jgi:hypothetical protein
VRTTQQKLVVEDRLYLGDHVGYSDRTDPIAVVADGTRLTAMTAHAQGFQTLTADGRPLALMATHAPAQVPLGATRAPRRVVSPARNVVLSTDGVFAFASAQFFDPLPMPLQWYTDEATLDAAGIRYVFTTEEAPVRDGEASVATVSFATADLATTEKGAYRFVLSAPGLRENGHALHLESVRVTLSRPASSLMDALRRLIGGPRRPPVSAGIANTVPDGEAFGEIIP